MVLKGILVAVGLLVATCTVFVWQAVVLPKDSGSAEQYSFAVTAGENAFQIAKHLEQAGLIRSRIGFDVYAVVRGIRRDLKAGTYFLSPSMRVEEIAEKIVAGEDSPLTIRILEGWRAKDIARYLQDRGIVEGEDFLLASQNLEGYLFPDTYQIASDTSAQAIVEMMQENFEGKLTAEFYAAVQRQGKTLNDIVIMASMLEKEVQSKEDKKVVAGILWKRMAQGIPLQVDATVAYGSTEEDELSQVELQTPSPYNTYLIQGLPAGPISNPGAESLEAALFPVETAYLYYLSALNGTTIFSETLEEHNIQRVKHLR
ncbi:MAG TPA: endolytic transglycosylase MltG [Candidatus Paceibacterota bacterium]|nr:endolytic transglycosylase MltG [Candidatus Paceibacterota bacterium]